MFQEERREKVVEYIKNSGYMEISKLAQELGVSGSTIRRDLDFLQESGLLKRIHGGAGKISGKENEMSFTFFREQINRNKEEKLKIAKAASELVEDGETVILDSGTTTYFLAEQLKNKNIQVVTNSLPVINLLAESNVDLIAIGGNLYPNTGVFLSLLTEDTFRQINADKLFMGVGGIDEEQITNRNMLLVGIQKVMMTISKEIIVIADHTKFDKKVLNHLTDISSVNRIITDSEVPEKYKNICKKKEVLLTIS